MKATEIWLSRLFLAGFCFVASCGKAQTHSRDEVEPRETGERPDTAYQATRGNDDLVASGDVVAVHSARQETLKNFVSRWEGNDRNYEGEAKQVNQRNLTLEVIGHLGGCPELIELLDFLTAKGAGDLRESLTATDLASIFTGPNARESREWLLTLEDEKLRERLSRQAGEMFSGMGFKAYFDEMGQYGGLHSQAALLTGYCVTMAKTDPEGAIRVYKEFAYPQRIDNSGMDDIMSAIPANSDFLKFATETKEDALPLAKQTRSALLENWATVKPQDAAQYVLGNSATTVHPDQMGVVIGTWAEKAPDAAEAWLSKAPEGAPRDEGTAAMARYWVTNDPVKAWEFAGQVGDFNKRVETATAVFKEWEKTDRNAATKAWVALFPGK